MADEVIHHRPTTHTIIRGVKHGSSIYGPPCPAVPTDGPNAVMTPNTALAWTCVANGITAPDYFWPLQETSGNLVDIANDVGGVLTPSNGSGTFSYANTVAGWTRKAIGTTEATGVRADATAGNLWNISTQSLLVCIYTAILGAGGIRWFLDLGGTSNVEFGCLATGAGHLQINSLTYDGSFIYKNASATVYPFVVAYDKRGAGASWWNTNKERIAGTYATYGDNTKGIGRSTLAAPPARHLLMAVWVGEKAEAMMDRGGAGLGGKQLVTDLGWPMAF